MHYSIRELLKVLRYHLNTIYYKALNHKRVDSSYRWAGIVLHSTSFGDCENCDALRIFTGLAFFVDP